VDEPSGYINTLRCYSTSEAEKDHVNENSTLKYYGVDPETYEYLVAMEISGNDWFSDV